MQLAQWRHFNADLPIMGREGRSNPVVPNDDDAPLDPGEDDPDYQVPQKRRRMTL